MWYDKQQLLSHNKIMNFVLSNRGGGKTFHFTRWAIDKFKKTGKQTVWVRRYGTELNDPEKGIMVKNRYFEAVKEYYPDDELKIEGSHGMINGEPAIIFIALSTSQQMKSVNFPNVDLIVFDEFIIKNGRVSYLPAEVETFLDLFETIARLRDNVRAVLLANNITVVNPYFLYFKIRPDMNKRFNIQGQICIEYFTDADFINKKKQTRFGQLVDGTRYGDFAIDNKPLLDSDTFIEEKTPNSEFMLALKYNDIFYGFWVDYNKGLIYVNNQYDPYSYSLYCLTKDDHEPNLLLVKSLNDNKRVQRIIYGFRNGLIRFSDMQVKNQFYEFIGYFVR